MGLFDFLKRKKKNEVSKKYNLGMIWCFMKLILFEEITLSVSSWSSLVKINS